MRGTTLVHIFTNMPSFIDNVDATSFLLSSDCHYKGINSFFLSHFPPTNESLKKKRKELLSLSLRLFYFTIISLFLQ